jgi:uncharacterized membrane protein YeiH
LFTVVGIEKTLSMGFDNWVAIMMGMITGAAGGVIRDIFINQIPLIFRKDIYAIACIIGGIVYFTCSHFGIGNELAQITCAVSVAMTRIIAIKFGIALPKIKPEENQDK